MALHALLYCERLFYLEEVEEIRVADANVYAGRKLHLERVPLDDETPEYRSLEVASEAWGLIGKVDAVRKRDGQSLTLHGVKHRVLLEERNFLLNLGSFLGRLALLEGSASSSRSSDHSAGGAWKSPAAKRMRQKHSLKLKCG